MAKSPKPQRTTPFDSPQSGMESIESGDSALDAVWHVLSAFASLKLTISLLTLSVLLIFVGTLAQAEEGMWHVMAKYFRSPWFWVENWVFFPRNWFPSFWETGEFGPEFGFPLPDGRRVLFPMPGGMTIGLCLIVNLLMAHLIRFKVVARGQNLVTGCALLGLGITATVAVIAKSQIEQVIAQRASVGVDQAAWYISLVGMISLGIAPVAIAASQRLSQRSFAGLIFLAGAYCTAVIGLFVSGWIKPSDFAAMRILWQLIQGGVAAGILYAACRILYGRRGGVALTHGGVALLMLGELLVSLTAVESQMTIPEKGTSTYAQDTRAVELAILSQSSNGDDDVVVVPQRAIMNSLARSREKPNEREAGLIADRALPFQVRVLDYHENCETRRLEEGEETPATKGLGLYYTFDITRKSAGADSGGEVDRPGALIEVFDKKSGESLGKRLVSVDLSLMNSVDSIEVDGVTYDLCLRFRRDYKDYSIKLIDVRKDDYLGTSTPRNYSSEISLTRFENGAPVKGSEREVLISMNQPLRYNGETFYQSGYFQDPTSKREQTTLQVVSNFGWMIPYISCMLVAFGMFARFTGVLLAYLTGVSEKSDAARSNSFSSWDIAITASALTCSVILFYGGIGRPPKHTVGFDLATFGKLPVVDGGRTKPIDSLARIALRTISNSDSVRVPRDPDKLTSFQKFMGLTSDKVSATQWLLETIVESKEADDYLIFRIENQDVQKLLGLEERASPFRYSWNEIGNQENWATLQRETQRIAGKPKEIPRSSYEKKVLELDRRVKAYMTIAFSVRATPLPRSLVEEAKSDPKNAAMRIVELMQDMHEQIDSAQPALLAPIQDEKLVAIRGRAWMPLGVARDYGLLTKLTKRETEKGVEFWETMIESYRDGKAKEFNAAAANYRDWVTRTKFSKSRDGAVEIPTSKIDLEYWLGTSSADVSGIVLYVVAFVLAWMGLLLNSNGARKFVWWMLAFTFMVHTLILAVRIYVSGRPPVTNLYSSAVFIGWVGVLAGLALEFWHRIHLSNIVSAMIGFVSLLIASYLSNDGDTLGVLQAVLDTQFWLATHVVCVTVGYAATFLAGAIGALYLIAVWPKAVAYQTGEAVVAKAFKPDSAVASKRIYHMMYGVTCFALFFSFVGTILGGLWADDSWGRFWGWDPKENGALMIVLWNAIMLHARWDGLAKEKGFAILAVLGNIVTAWSWFGVNQLGVGLHSYGFTDGVLQALGWFVVSQLAIVAFGLVRCLGSSRPAIVESVGNSAGE